MAKNPFEKVYGPQDDGVSRQEVVPASLPIKFRESGATINNPFLRRQMQAQRVRTAPDAVVGGQQVLVPGRSYWDNPMRVAKYHDAVKAAEAQGTQMQGVDHEAIKAIYGYYRQINGSEDWSTWKTPAPDDPVREIIGYVPPPPLHGMTEDDLKEFTPAYYVPRDSDYYTISEAEAEALGLDASAYQRQGENLLIPATDFSAYEPDEMAKADEISGMPAAEYDQLRWWQKLMVDMTPAGSGAVSGGAMGAFGGIPGMVIGTGLGALFGKASELNEDGTPRYPAASAAMRLLNVLDYPAELVERGMGVGVQMLASLQKPDTYGSFNEIMENLPAAWQAGHLAYETAVPWLHAGKEEIPTWNLTSPDPTMMQVPEGARDTVGILHMRTTGINALALQEARQRIVAGEDAESVYADISERFGLAAQFREMFGHVLMDPLNLIGVGELEAGSSFARLIKNVPLEQAFRAELNTGFKASTLGALQRYGQALRLLPAEDAAKFSRLSRVIAGIDDDGLPREYSNPERATALQKLFGLTPQAKAYTMLTHLTEGLDAALANAVDTSQIAHTVRALAGLPVADAVRYVDEANVPRYFASGEAQPVPIVMKTAAPRIQKELDSWAIATPQRQALERMAQALSTPERQVAVADVVRRLGEAETPQALDTAYRAMMQTLQENVVKGLIPESEFKALLEMGGDNLGKAAKLFMGGDGLPFSFDMLKARISEVLAQTIETWAVDKFQIKPLGWANRAAQTIKSMQALTLLNVPTFAAQNFLSNIMTMAWDGLLPLGTTQRGRRAWLKEMGYNTGLMRRGMSAADVGEIGDDLAAAAELQRGRKPYKLGETLRKALRGEGAWARADEQFQQGVQKLAVFPRLSQKFEQYSSEMAYYAAIRTYWEQAWRPGVGFDRMSKDYKLLADYLDAARPGASARIEALIAKGRSRAEIESAIFNGFDAPSLKDVLGADELNMLNAFPGLVDGLEADLKQAQTPAQVRGAFSRVRERVTADVRAEVRRRAREQATNIISRIGLEGVSGAADAFDEVINVRTDALLSHFQRMQQVADDIERRGLRGNERAAAWQNARRLEDNVFRSLEDDEASKWLGMFAAMGAGEEDTGKLMAMLGNGSGDILGLHMNWRQYFDQLQEEFANFYALPDDMDKAAKSAEWAAMNERLNQNYVQALLEEDRAMTVIDDLGARLYAAKNNKRKNAYDEYMNWRLGQREVRRQQAAVMAGYRMGAVPDALKSWGAPAQIIEKLQGFTRGMPLHMIAFDERAVINKMFYEEIYTPFIRDMQARGQGGPIPAFDPLYQSNPQADIARAQREYQLGILNENDYQTIVRRASDQAAVWETVAKLRPELAGATESGWFDRSAKQNLIRYVRKHNPDAGVKRFDDITPEAFARAVRNEEMRARAQPQLPETPAQTRLPENANLRAQIDEELVKAENLGMTLAEARRAIFTDERGSGAMNLRAFERDLAGIRSRQQQPVVAFLDLRGLGKTNKLFGDPVGDAYLKRVVEIAQEQGQTIYRKGGDEFLLLGTDPAAMTDALTALSESVERSIIEVNGTQYAGLKFHAGTGPDIGAADAAALAALAADPDAARYQGKQYALTPTPDADTNRPGGLDMGEAVGAEPTLAEAAAVEAARAAATEGGELKLSPEEVVLDQDTIDAARELDAVLVADDGQVLTPDLIEPRTEIEWRAPEMNERERAFSRGRMLPPEVDDALRRQAETMQGELAQSRVVMLTDAEGNVTGRQWEGAPDWYRRWYEELKAEDTDFNTRNAGAIRKGTVKRSGKASRLNAKVKAALRRVRLGEEPANPEQAALMGRLRNEIMGQLSSEQGYNRDVAWWLGHVDDVFAIEGEEIARIVNDPNTTAEQARAALGRNADAIIDEYLTRASAGQEASADAPDVADVPAPEPQQLQRQAEAIADAIDEAEAAADPAESYAFGREALERALMTHYPDKAEAMLALLDELAQNFNPELQGQALLDRIGWRFGEEFGGQEGVQQKQQGVYYRGTNPGDTRRIKTGVADWDKRLFVTETPNNAKWYGSSIERIELSKSARILREGSSDFNKLAGRPKGKESFLDWANRVVVLAEKRGYDAVHFSKQTDVGTVIINRAAIARRDKYKGPLFQKMAGLNIAGVTRFAEDLRGLVDIFRSGDVHTVAHETIHSLTPYLTQADADTVRRWVGADMPEDWHTSMMYASDGQTLSPEFQGAYEKLARGFERYLTTGKAPNTRIRAVFEKIQNWMIRIYRKLTGSPIDVEISDEVRAMFDRWMGGEEAVSGQLSATGPEAPAPPEPSPSFWDAPAGQATLFGEAESPWQLQAQRGRMETFTPQAEAQAPLFERGPVQGIPEQPRPAPEAAMPEGGLFGKEAGRIITGPGEARPRGLYQANPVDMPVGTSAEIEGPPVLEATLEGLSRHLLPALEKAEAGLVERVRTPNRLPDIQDMDPQMQRQLRSYMGKVLNQQMPDTKLAAQRWGETKRNFALLPYERKLGIDNSLLTTLGFPYEFWYTRSMMNWALRALNKPALVANYLRLQRYFNDTSTRSGFPTRLKRKSMIRLPFLPDWMGEGVYIDPQKQLFPFLQLTGPFERMAEQNVQEQRQAETILQRMIEDGEVSAADGEYALANRSGDVWQMALAQARQERDQDVQNPLDFAWMLSGPSLPVGIAYKYLTGRQDEISQLPTTRFIQTVTGALGLGGPRGINVEGPFRRAAGIPEIDRFEDYRVDRMLANLAAEGRISTDEALRGMIDREGAAFEMAQRRVSATATMSYFGAPLGVDLFPEGEQLQRQLKDEYDRARAAWSAGDDEALNKFWDKYPEYEARRQSFYAIDGDYEGRLRQFLISEVWDRYMELPRIHKEQVRDELGEIFVDAFLSKETRSYDSVDTETLAYWAQAMGGHNPQAAPDIPRIPLDLAPKAEAEAVEAFYNEQEQRFPGLGQVLNAYYAMPSAQQQQFNASFPQIDKYYRWKNAYLAAHPQIIPWVIGEGSTLYGLPADIQTAVYQYRATKDYEFPDIDRLQDQYFDLDRAGRKQFLNQHPQLKDYWDWREQAAAENPKAAPYILSEKSLQNAILTDYRGEVQPLQYGNILSQESLAQLYANTYGRERLRPGALTELRQLWESQGRPYGSLEAWIEAEVRPSLVGQ